MPPDVSGGGRRRDAAPLSRRQAASAPGSADEIALVAKWEALAVELDELGALVNGARLCRAFLADLVAARETAQREVLSLAEASAWSGYSEAHLARLVKDGKLRTLRPIGSRGRLSFNRADLPRKPGSRHTTVTGVHELASRLYGGKERRHGSS